MSYDWDIVTHCQENNVNHFSFSNWAHHDIHEWACEKRDGKCISFVKVMTTVKIKKPVKKQAI